MYFFQIQFIMIIVIRSVTWAKLHPKRNLAQEPENFTSLRVDGWLPNVGKKKLYEPHSRWWIRYIEQWAKFPKKLKKTWCILWWCDLEMKWTLLVKKCKSFLTCWKYRMQGLYAMMTHHHAMEKNTVNQSEHLKFHWGCQGVKENVRLQSMMLELE